MKGPPPALAEPRSLGGIALRLGALVYLPFVLGIGWIVATLFAWSFADVLPYSLVGGVVFSTVFGLSNARFLQVETVIISFDEVKTFLAGLNLATAQLGYYPATTTGDFYTYCPSFQTGWAAGSIAVQIGEGGHAVVVGPRVFVRKLVEKLKPE